MNVKLKKLQTLSDLYRKKQLGFNYTTIDLESSSASCELSTDIKELSSAIKHCHLCALSKSRRYALGAFGCGSSKIMIVIDSPNASEDEIGAYYHGKSGVLLKNMVEKGLKLSTDEIYLTSIIKCFTPNQSIRSNYLPFCKPYILAEIKALKPKVILSLGQTAFEGLTGFKEPILQARGKRHQISIDGEKFVVIPSFAPSYLELNPQKKHDTMRDLMQVLQIAQIHS